MSLVYFRAGYIPTHYPTQVEWDGLLIVERSNAVKCPSIGLFLSGSKKVQQRLAEKGILEQFLDPSHAELLRTTFSKCLPLCFSDVRCFWPTRSLAGIYSLDVDDAETKNIIQQACDDPDSFVLKPQREGGCNNIWGQEIKKSLLSMNLEERAQFILMKRIRVSSILVVVARDI